ncbi:MULTISPECIES: AAA family ATPase [unclassified Mesorhizobium]|uniref:AAA family ATPase n=1 Tax=unclassified Mesorhizobium TaxID=325217 RepID=UPI001FDFB7CC|nr:MULTISPECIES: AAA family ATPase [unclassified Mesorhizobium]
MDALNRAGSPSVPDQKEAFKETAKEMLQQIFSGGGQGHRQKREPTPEPKAREIEVWSAAGIDPTSIPPREFLLGKVFARTFVSALFADGATGKTSLRIAQAVALATGRNLTDERVHKRCTVLLMCFEDDMDELERRVAAAKMHYRVSDEQIGDRLLLVAAGLDAGKIAVIDPDTRQPVKSDLAPTVEQLVKQYAVDLVILDPLKKIHGVEENSNDHMDFVVQVLTDMASRLKIAIDLPHHMSKGAADPGNANRGRGASALKDAIRLGYTLTHMSVDEAKTFGIAEDQRRHYVRVDPAKVNIAPQARAAQWFRLVSVNIGNSSKDNPHGDDVQVMTPWAPPELMAGMGGDIATRILREIHEGPGNGERYSDASAAGGRCVSIAFSKYVPGKSAADARAIVKRWITDGVLKVEVYKSTAQRRERRGLFLAKDPALLLSDHGGGE